MKENGQVDNVEIIPDFENEMVEETQPKKSGGCGCNKNKTATPTPNGTPAPTGYRWNRILMVAGGLVLLYFIFKKKGAKIEVPKVEVPEV
tara:strand:- start:3488 stop:3757 length:270 start_codon:yes stop_codon:yes gene_type:complete